MLTENSRTALLTRPRLLALEPGSPVAWNVAVPLVELRADDWTVTLSTSLSSRVRDSTVRVPGVGSKASTWPAGPTARAMITVNSPMCAPPSMTVPPSGHIYSRKDCLAGS